MPHGHADGRLRLRRTSLNVLFIAVLTVLAAAIYGTYSLYRYYQFNSGTYDLVIFDQAIRSYAHFRPGISIVKGLHNGFGPNFSVLGDHFSPILAALAPLYWIYNGPQDLLIAQAVLFALAVPPVWVFTRRALGGGARGTAGAYLVSVGYALSWPVAAAVDFDFHEAAFAPVLTAVALERLQAGRIRTALLALGLLLLVKEDMGLLVAGIGLVLVVARPHLNRQRLLGLALVIGGLAAAIVSLYVIIPAMGGRSDYYFAYGAFGSNVPQALLQMLEHPVRAATELISPRMKLDTMIWLVGAFAFLPLLSPITLAVVPLLLERMLSSSSSHWWSVQFHYNAFLVVVLVLAAVDGGARIGSWSARLRSYLSRPARGAASREPRRGPVGRRAGGGRRRLGGPACPRRDAPADRARDGPGRSWRRGDGIAVAGRPGGQGAAASRVAGQPAPPSAGPARQRRAGRGGPALRDGGHVRAAVGARDHVPAGLLRSVDPSDQGGAGGRGHCASWRHGGHGQQDRTAPGRPGHGHPVGRRRRHPPAPRALGHSDHIRGTVHLQYDRSGTNGARRRRVSGAPRLQSRVRSSRILCAAP